MNITTDKMVSVTYELKYDDVDAHLIEKVEKNSPLTFLYGKGKMLEHFEKELNDMKSGDLFDFKLTAEKAYGPVTQEAVVEVPLQAFEVEGKVDEEVIKLGNTVPMMDSYGNKLHGIVLEISDANVKMDFNHPLAGEDLHFKGKVVDVRDAKPEELIEEHQHGEGGCSTGSCGTDDSGAGGCCGC